MSRHTATVEWACGAQDFLSGRYSRDHVIRFDGGVAVAGSASPANVSAPWSSEAAVDPEEMFVAALSACHMLWFLDFARRSGAAVASYRDTAVGEMAQDAEGRAWVARVTLRPQVAFADPVVPPRMAEALHEQARRACFIANSVRTEVVIDPVATTPTTTNPTTPGQEERRHG